MSNAVSYIRRKLANEPAQTVESLLRRATCQIAFAQSFAEAGLGGSLADVQRAQGLLDAYDPVTGVEGLSKTVAEIEAALAEVAKAAKEYTIHLVAHGHIDMNWMWSWPETVSATHDTFASVLSLMEQYPELTYSQSQASVYALIEKYHPAMFERIRQRVKEGRWEVAAVHWVEGDKNISSGESLAHHLLYTRRYFEEKFGLSPEDLQLDWEPDTFGHANTIPTILAQGGVKYYYACRTGGGHHHPRLGEERPPVFWWQGPDGSRVLVNRETTWYNSYVNIGDNYAVPMVAFCKQTGLKDWLDVYGIGNHGGGPTRVEIEYFLESREWPCWPQVIFSTAQGWFRKAEKYIADNGLDIPVIDHELNYEFTGCYTSQSAIKKANRFGENYCVEAETLAALHGTPQPLLRDAWLNILFNQFHDILPGSGVAATREHALGLFQETGAITGAVKQQALLEIASNVNSASLLPDNPEGREEMELVKQGKANTPFVAGAGHGAWFSGLSTTSGGGRRFLPVVVYNPCAWTRTEIVEASLYDIDMDPNRLVARDENGVQFPTLVTFRNENMWATWGHRNTKIAFVAQGVPALGYKTFLICEGDVTADLPAVTVLDEAEFETPSLKLEFDRYACGIKRAALKPDDKHFTYSYEPLGNWEFVNEISRGMTSWVLGGVDETQSLIARKFRSMAPSRNEGTSAMSGDSSIIRLTHELEVPGRDSKVKVTTILNGFAPRVDFEAEIDWREIGTPEEGIPGLRIDFENLIDVANEEQVLFETPFGSVRRPSDDPREVPSLRYAHRYSEEGGLTILQDSKYGHEIDGTTLGLRVVRSSFDPDHAPEVAKSTLRYSVYFHDKLAQASELTRLGAAWNHPLIVTNATLQEGNLPPSKSYAEVKTPNVVLSGLKLAEDGNGLILRLIEHDGLETEAEVVLAPELSKSKAEICDLMERPTGQAATLAGNTLKVKIKPNSFVTVKLS